MQRTNKKKIVMLGHFGVGKTSLVRRFVDSVFSEDYLVTLGVQVKKKEIEIENQKITLIIWDIEGNSSISKTRSSYLTGTNGFLYVFDVSRPETFEKLEEEISFLNENYSTIPVCKIGNKSDLLISENKKDFFNQKQFEDCDFTSAKEGNNVENVFEKITKLML
jgi:small GTP-binding protein